MAAPPSKGQGGGSGPRNFNKPAKETSFGPGGSTQRGSRTAKPPPTAKERAATNKASSDERKAKTTKANESKAKTNASNKERAQKREFRRLVNEQGMSHAKAHEAVVAKFGNVSLQTLKNGLGKNAGNK